VMGKVHLPVAGFAGALGLAYLNLMFYEGLALMLATLFQERGPVLGMSVGLLYGWLVMGDRLLMKYAPFLPTVMPWNLLMSVGSSPALYEYLLSGRRLPAVAPVIATVLWCAVFVAVAVWRMNREEF